MAEPYRPLLPPSTPGDVMTPTCPYVPSSDINVRRGRLASALETAIALGDDTRNAEMAAGLQWIEGMLDEDLAGEGPEYVLSRMAAMEDLFSPHNLHYLTGVGSAQAAV